MGFYVVMWAQEDEQLVPMWFEMLEWEDTTQGEKNHVFLKDLGSCLLGLEKHALPQKTKVLVLTFLITWFSTVSDSIFKIVLEIR